MKRRKMIAAKDKRVFSATAAKSKAINLYPTVYRGGIRL